MDGLRIDAGFASATHVSTYYDSMLAKVIGYGATRDDARRVLASALSRARLHGVVTNRDLLTGILREPEFQAGAIDTGYLGRHSPAELCTDGGAEAATRVHLLAAALAEQSSRREQAPVLSSLPSGWRNNPSGPQQARYETDSRQFEIRYRFDRGRLHASVDDSDFPPLVVREATPEAVDLEIGGIRRMIRIVRAGRVSYVDSALGHSALTELERFPDPSAAAQAGSLLAPMPGTVVRVNVAVGDHVEEGAAVMAIEAMKMEHSIRAPARGIVTEIPVTVGAQVDSGMVLAVVDDSEEESGE
jgi:propionyl-CoA carboxylase alpha chain